MLLLGMDTETTGLDTTSDRIIELGLVVWDVPSCSPIDIYTSFIKPPPEFFPLKPEVKEVTGIQEKWLQDYGRELPQVMDYVQKMIFNRYEIEYIVAHNGEGYDKPLTMAELARHGIENHSFGSIPWLDTRTDIPYDKPPDSFKLKHLALDAGFINPFPHRAVYDVSTTLKVLSRHDIFKVIEQSKIPWVVMRACVDYNDRQLAKDMRYSWENLGDKKYPKFWVKKIRQNMVDHEIKACLEKGFKAARIE